jgi:hypothetical protein
MATVAFGEGRQPRSSRQDAAPTEKHTPSLEDPIDSTDSSPPLAPFPFAEFIDIQGDTLLLDHILDRGE